MDIELLGRIRQGDKSAFHELVDRYAGQLFGVAYSLLGNAADAEDAVQETFAGAFKGLSSFRGQASVKTWLLRILARQVAGCRRSNVRQRRILVEAQDSSPDNTQYTAASPEVGVDQRLDVMSMLQTLSPEHRDVVVLREFEGLSYGEMAEALGVPQGTVESRLHRARQELRQRFKEYL
ncbi:MAG: RNA polymerase sigma factor [Bacillota bacterium]